MHMTTHGKTKMLKWFKKKKQIDVIDYLKSISPVGPIEIRIEHDGLTSSGTYQQQIYIANEYIDFRTIKEK